ncbi:NAD-dependent epimerase/dehydratase family protein [Streptomyces kanasensis]|uniref:NAD-dependent epimerase/dehydratase family protein n=1 Tax=Streptomyces kanasensis TaxID=936756 RepID=UPI0036FA2609
MEQLGRRVAVTGATGFIGRRLCHRVTRSGGQVVAVVRGRSDRSVLDGCPVRFATVDLERGHGLAEALAGVDAVVHLAAAVRARSRAWFETGNVHTTRALLEAVAHLDTPPRVVLCSSLAAAGPSAPGRPRREEDPAAPVSRYGRSKLAAEQVARGFAGRVPLVVVRPPIVYGPGDPAFLPSLLAMARTGVALQPGSGETTYSLLHVDDLCEGLLAAAVTGGTAHPADPHSGLYQLSDGREHVFADLVRAAGSALRRRPVRVLRVPAPLVRAAGALAEAATLPFGKVPPFNRDKAREAVWPAWTASPERARRELGFAHRVEFEDGLRAAVAETTPRS